MLLAVKQLNLTLTLSTGKEAKPSLISISGSFLLDGLGENHLVSPVSLCAWIQSQYCLYV